MFYNTGLCTHCVLYVVGVCYKDGKGVAKNKPEAKKYLKLAADQGFAGAAVKLSQFWF